MLKFETVKKEKNIKYIVKHQYNISGTKVCHNVDKVFYEEDVNKAFEYIRTLQKDAKNYPEIFVDDKIILIKQKTLYEEFLVLGDTKDAEKE